MTFTVTRKGTGPALIKAPAVKRFPWGKIILVVLAIVLALIVAHPALAQTQRPLPRRRRRALATRSTMRWAISAAARHPSR
jgi:hypothetical protein